MGLGLALVRVWRIYRSGRGIESTNLVPTVYRGRGEWVRDHDHNTGGWRWCVNFRKRKGEGKTSWSHNVNEAEMFEIKGEEEGNTAVSCTLG